MTFFVLALLNLAAPFIVLGVILKFLLSSRRGLLRDLPGEINERLGGISEEALAKLAGRPVLWVHVASAGEVAAVDEFLRQLHARPDAPAILLTTMTQAGKEAAGRLAQVDAACLAPVDSWPTVSRFLRKVRPYALILVETELWPNMIALSTRAGLRVGMVNARISDRSFPRYRFIACFLRPFLRRLERVAAQTEVGAQRLAALGVASQAVMVVGNMKYDRLKVRGDDRGRLELQRLGWQDFPLFVVGSTHPVEEEMLIQAFLEVRRQIKDLKLVLAPRHVERSDAAAESLSRLGVRFARLGVPQDAGEALLVDTMGWLSSFYACADVAFVGGSLVPVGGHNLLEPAAFGKPVIFGPHTAHARQAAASLQSCGGGFEVADASALAVTLGRLLTQPSLAKECGRKAQDMVHRLQGATGRTLAHLSPILTPGRVQRT